MGPRQEIRNEPTITGRRRDVQQGFTNDLKNTLCASHLLFDVPSLSIGLNRYP